MAAIDFWKRHALGCRLARQRTQLALRNVDGPPLPHSRVLVDGHRGGRLFLSRRIRVHLQLLDRSPGATVTLAASAARVMMMLGARQAVEVQTGCAARLVTGRRGLRRARADEARLLGDDQRAGRATAAGGRSDSGCGVRSGLASDESVLLPVRGPQLQVDSAVEEDQCGERDDARDDQLVPP